MSALEIAKDLVNGERQNDYGHPAVDFEKSAKMLSALGYRFIDDSGVYRDLTAFDIPMFMTCVKLSRESHKRKVDNRVDIIGYMLCSEKIEEYYKAPCTE